MQCIEWVNLCCLMPFSLYAMYAFARGDARVRLPGVIVSSFTFYSLILCIGSTLFGPVRSSDPVMFTAIYVPYLIMPALAIARLWPEKPFAPGALGGVARAVQWVGTTATLAVFFSYVLKWFLLCEPGMLPQALLPHLDAARRLPGGDVCPTA